MADMPAATIFRSFAALNIENLLHMQAELESLECELREIQKQDAEAQQEHSKRRNYSRDWYKLMSSDVSVDGSQQQNTTKGEEIDQCRIVKDIRQKLKDYSRQSFSVGLWRRYRSFLLTMAPDKALLRFMKVLSATKPDEHDRSDIELYLRTEEMLCGKDQWIWNTVEGDCIPTYGDLITLQPRAETDRMTKWITDWLLKRLSKKDTRGQTDSVVAFRDETVSRWTFVATSGFAAMLPVASMLALQRVEDVQVHRLSLWLIAVFNFVLAILITGLTSVKRIEVFAVASAFAAVNVVFIAK